MKTRKFKFVTFPLIKSRTELLSEGCSCDLCVCLTEAGFVVSRFSSVNERACELFKLFRGFNPKLSNQTIHELSIN